MKVFCQKCGVKIRKGRLLHQTICDNCKLILYNRLKKNDKEKKENLQKGKEKEINMVNLFRSIDKHFGSMVF